MRRNFDGLLLVENVKGVVGKTQETQGFPQFTPIVTYRE